MLETKNLNSNHVVIIFFFAILKGSAETISFHYTSPETMYSIASFLNDKSPNSNEFEIEELIAYLKRGNTGLEQYSKKFKLSTE